ncbi:MAG: hypothetical protein GY737_07950 [Desulfobacteraceae bacterium]|nr:hypothetical protein [Desulfobacteraceae bacterium]
MGGNNGSDTSGGQFVRFTVGGLSMGIDILGVREVAVIPGITPVQHAPSFVRGLINLRGQPVTVVDLGVKSVSPGRTLTGHTHVIVLKKAHVGILVDTIGDIVPVPVGGIEPLPSNMDLTNIDVIDGVVKLEHEPMYIVFPVRLLDAMAKTSGGAGE